MKKEERKQLKSKNIKELQELLREKEKELNKLISITSNKQGSSKLVRNYPKEPRTGFKGNIKDTRKDIARIKTFLNIKLKQ